uniref:Phytocyanin domain-containing protein n=1 Tax=Kalanchoe fedtschenkoi TaxID=63787 RepID=A0A7N0SYJ7_KALFE
MEKLVCGICVFIGVFLISSCAATIYTVGDTAGWDISADLDTWPIDKNFTVGDVLMFQYSQSNSVSEVTKQSYDGCNTTVTLKTYTGGNSNVTLTKPGDMYFICGNKLLCLGGMKLQIYVQEGQVVAYAPAPAPSAGRFELPKPSTKKNNNPARTTNPASSASGLEYNAILMMIISAMATFFITCN